MARRMGFTLVEVLVALAIFAIGAVALISAQSNQARISAGLEERVFAQIAAENELLLVLAGPQPDLGIRRGDTASGPYAFSWTRTVSETSLPNIVRVEVTVTPPGTQFVLARLTGLRGR